LRFRSGHRPGGNLTLISANARRLYHRSACGPVGIDPTIGTMKLDPELSSSGASAPSAQPSRLARWALAACAGLIVYGSLTPWTGWRDTGVGALAYLVAPWPRHLTLFDVVVNVLAYMPLGSLGMLALYPRWRGFRAAAAMTALGIALSAGMEALQTYLPSRVASSVDLLTNGLGTLLGAGVAAPFVHALLDRGAPGHVGSRWFRRDAAPALVLLALWPIAQIDPGPMLFGNGRAGLESLPTAMPALSGAQPVIAAWAGFGPVEFMLAEGVVTFCGLLAAGLALVSTLRPSAPHHPLLAALCIAALGSKALAYGLEFGGPYALVWVTPGALSGLALGGACLIVAAHNGRAVLLSRVSLICLCTLIAVVNLVPANPYHTLWIEQWDPGKLRHVSAVAAWLSMAWPYAMLVWQAYDGLPRRRTPARRT
jgi:VanZ family protein